MRTRKPVRPKAACWSPHASSPPRTCTAVGPAGVHAVMAQVKRDPAVLAAQQERLQAGQTIMAAAWVAGQPVGIGSHQPVESVTEIVGVGVLPAFRRRGIAAALTSRLVD